MTDPPRLAVVIVSFEVREALLACLDSLVRHVAPPFETAVVDNASTDGSADAVRARHPGVGVVVMGENAGFARACNVGLRATTAPSLLFLNPDAEVETGAVEALLSRLETQPDAGIVAPRLRAPDGTVEVSTGPDLTPLAEWRQRRRVRGVARREPRTVRELTARLSREHEPDWVSGAAFLARREALESVGGFDEGFFLYEEDADLCRRLRRAGWRIVFTPDAEVRHRRGASMARAPARARLEYHRSHLRYYRKHNGRVARGVLRLLLLGRALGEATSGLLCADVERREEAASLLRLALS
jgi:N-acetylglucosaminyl-diphospho-decaprenol L-rhamnosyltransferase